MDPFLQTAPLKTHKFPLCIQCFTRNYSAPCLGNSTETWGGWGVVGGHSQEEQPYNLTTLLELTSAHRLTSLYCQQLWCWSGKNYFCFQPIADLPFPNTTEFCINHPQGAPEAFNPTKIPCEALLHNSSHFNI